MANAESLTLPHFSFLREDWEVGLPGRLTLSSGHATAPFYHVFHLSVSNPAWRGETYRKTTQQLAPTSFLTDNARHAPQTGEEECSGRELEAGAVSE